MCVCAAGERGGSVCVYVMGYMVAVLWSSEEDERNKAVILFFKTFWGYFHLYWTVDGGEADRKHLNTRLPGHSVCHCINCIKLRRVNETSVPLSVTV